MRHLGGPAETGRRSLRTIARTITPLAIAVVATLASASPAAAQEGDPADPSEQIVLSGTLVIAEGETVESAVSFNGPATIEGRVTDSLVVFNGATEIAGTVDGDVVVFNGPVVVRSSATIDGDLVTVEAPTVEPGATIRGDQQRFDARFDAARLGLASRIAWWIGYSVSTLLLGLALLALAPGLDAAIASAVRTRLGASFGLGALTFFLLPVVAVLLLVIVVAIPLGLFLMLAFALLYTVGYVAGAHALGRRLVREPSSRFVAFLAGWAILRGIGLIPVLGGLVWIVAAIAGLGVLVLAARSRAETSPPPGTEPSMPPMPQPTP
jgi:hypothetical protein